jgi:hypothetical protein
MKEKAITFIVAIFINGGLYAGITYFMDTNLNKKQLLFNFLFFGILMAIFQVFILPGIKKDKNKNKK